MKGFVALGALVVVACGSSRPLMLPGDDDATPDTASAPDAPPAIVDDDHDGLDDARELELAADYEPFLSLDANDGCSRSGLLVRVRPHPADPTKILVIYDHLFETDCGLGGHTGDNEVFGVAVDPARPPPAGILAITAISHQNTPCERVSECTTCTGDGRSACDTGTIGGVAYPIVYASKDKHGQYATKSACGFGTCFDSCATNATPQRPPIANAGEPGHALVSNLTTEGFITAANGWTKPELMDFDPWGTADFGGAGNVADDLVDPAFEVAPCAP